MLLVVCSSLCGVCERCLLCCCVMLFVAVAVRSLGPIVVVCCDALLLGQPCLRCVAVCCNC